MHESDTGFSTDGIACNLPVHRYLHPSCKKGAQVGYHKGELLVNIKYRDFQKFEKKVVTIHARQALPKDMHE